jgi:hypothetical protein
MANYAWCTFHGLLFSMVQPVFFLNKPDVTGNLLMISNLQHLLLHSQWLRIGFDASYLLLPCLLVFACFRDSPWQKSLAIATAIFSIIYNYFFSIVSFVSTEVYVAWMLVPLIFMSRSAKGFYYSMHALRAVFLLFFFSTAVWKIRAGGVFNVEQFSGILFSQHLSSLVNAESDLFHSFISWLISNPKMSYAIYLTAFLFEFAFVIGFFTRKLDRFFIVIFCLFIMFDYLLMGINYFSWLPFLGTLYFSLHHREDARKMGHHSPSKNIS